MSKAVAKTENKPITLRDHIAKMQPEFAKALPGHISPERFVRTTQTAIALTRNIEKVKNPQSLLAACTKAAADGLILDGREATLVVDYQGDVQYRPMMRGLLRLAYNSGEIRSIVVEIVCENDEFIYSPTDEREPIRHVIDLRKPRGEIYAVYAKAVLKDGGIVFEVMTVEDVNRIRDRSDAYRAFKSGKIKSTPWSTDWSEMARKTVFRRLSKYLPSSTDRLHQAVERIDEEYTMGHAEEPEADPVEQPVRKKRGAAAAALKNVKPEPEQEIEDAEIIENDEPPHDPETGEIIEPDSADDDDDDDDEQRPGDDI